LLSIERSDDPRRRVGHPVPKIVIVQVAQGDTPAGTLEYRTIFAVGLALFVTTMFLNVLAQWFVARVREKYE
jgi:ABC-type phosphate transport system permease subunit